jgi:allantoate deiminase
LSLPFPEAAVAESIESRIRVWSGPPYSAGGRGTTRYAFTEPYCRTVRDFGRALESLGLTLHADPVGNLVGRPVGASPPRVAVGSHLDSVRNGGPWDGVLGVVSGVELARLAHRRRSPPPGVVSWIEEEGSGFGQMLLGSRAAAGQLSTDDLASSVRSLDDGRAFTRHWSESFVSRELPRVESVLDGAEAWIEIHIEQGRVLESASATLGVVRTIAGYVHADLELNGRADHAGATPMELRSDPTPVAGSVILAVERCARSMSVPTVATVGELVLDPGAPNVIPGRVVLSLDVRSRDDSSVDAVLDAARVAADHAALARGVTSHLRIRQRRRATRLDIGLADDLQRTAAAMGVEPLMMDCGAAHDTMVVAAAVPAALLLIPCRDGVSHSPDETADPLDAARAVSVVDSWLRRLTQS